jgi:hypothetical protein
MFSSTQLELEYVKAKKDVLLIKMAQSEPSSELIDQLKYLNDIIDQLKTRISATID